jgi:glycosyltransferase involved in cell wall biosynthesis
VKLSVITVNLNNDIGLKKTMESVFAQTFKDFEFIIVDGASNDNSLAVIQSFNHSIIQSFSWISEPDTGIFNAMNKGINLSKGEYLLFLNSGDFLFSATVFEEIFGAKEYKEDFICAKCAVSRNGQIEFITNPPQNFTFKNFYNTTLAHQSTFIRVSLFSKYGKYREDLKLKSDWEFFVRTIILNQCTTIRVDVVLTDYNLDGVSAQLKNREKQREEMNKIYSETNLSKFIPDYAYYASQTEEMKMYFWVKEKRLLNLFIQHCYRTAKLFSKIKKSN